MCNLRCFIAFVALSVGAVHSWDVAITTRDQLEFYANKTKIDNVGAQFRDLTALAYDAVHNMLLFVDKQNDNASIFSYHLATKKYQSLVRKRSIENIQGIAFDPVTSLLFWTDSSEMSIFSISLKPGSKNNAYGNLLIKMDDEIPRAIAVDSCRGYVYWTNTNVTKPTIERAKFDGTDRKIIVSKDVYMPVSLVIDQRTKKLYWVDDKEGIHYSIESSDLEGGNRETLLVGVQHQPNALTVSKDDIYWVDWGYKMIWKLPKDAKKNAEPEEWMTFRNEVPYGIVANYQLEDQTEGVGECKEYTSLSQDKSVINDSFSVPPDLGLFCVHGMKVKGKLECLCTPGYTGDRCDISECQNFCFQGDCSITADGKPTCSCNSGYTGSRCETSLCHNHCLNNGQCSLVAGQPTCACAGDHEGARCERERIYSTEAARVPELEKSECNCDAPSTLPPLTAECAGWDGVRDPAILALGALSGLLLLACAALLTKILQLKKRPRIKKRIIVNKNVTPMTARPDQCEITIENCCNMNICETPCFEPRSTIRPSLLDTKPGKEEKKNLIANIEYPDDY